MALGRQLRRLIFMLHLSLHLSLFAVFSDLSISAFIFLPTFTRHLTPRRPALSLSANLLGRICLTFPLRALPFVSRLIPEGTIKTIWMCLG